MIEKQCFCGGGVKCPENTQELKALVDEGQYNLLFAGVDVGVNKHYIKEVCPDCSRNMSLNELGMFIQLNPAGEVIVDWKKYVKDNNAKDDPNNYINNVLCKLKILSGFAQKNWIVMSQTQGCLNPFFGRSVNLYFTSPDTALAYAIAYMAVSFAARRCHVIQLGHVFQV
ncbi:MAG: hypothetical protein WC823_06155 [Parcubacteria group bacterium]|jgi:hypothetical protein